MPRLNVCPEKDLVYWSGGVGARLDFVSTWRPRLILAGIATVVSDGLHVGPELGLAFERHNSILPVSSVQIGAGPLVGRYDYTWAHDHQVSGGLLIARDLMPWWGISCSVGRPLRDHGGAIHKLAASALHREFSDSRQHAAATIWADRTLAEWASIPAFLQLAEQLAVLNAPAALIHSALQSADDEARHAAMAASVVAKLGGGSVVLPGGLPLRVPLLKRQEALRQLATESWWDGCVNEGIAAATARIESAGCTSPAIRETLSQIARDERAHAGLAWQILRWALAEGGDDTRHDLWRALGQSPHVVPVAIEDDLGMFGCGDTALQSNVIARILDESTREAQGELRV